MSSRPTILNRDDRRGHFALIGLDGPGEAQGEVVGASLGDVLHLWTSGAHLNRTDARKLAEALVWWADRRDAVVGPESAPSTPADLPKELLF